MSTKPRTRETHYGSIYTDRIDATGYTRFVVVDQIGERFVVDVEWVPFDSPLPPSKPEAATGRLFRFYDREAVR